MSEKSDIQHSILIVSASESFSGAMKTLVPAGLFSAMEVRRNGAAARQCIHERYYNIVVINSPLPDETGVELAVDAAEETDACVMLLTPSESFDDAMDRVTDAGVLVVPKPAQRGTVNKGVRLLAAIQNKMITLSREADKAREKTEEIRMVDRAKFILMEKKKMTEEEAHRFIGKQAMDSGMSRVTIARQIIDDYM